MKLVIILAILLLFLGGCSVREKTVISGVQDLMLNEQDLQQLGMTDKHDCQTDNEYSNIIDSTLSQHTSCTYTILEDTGVTVELEKFANKEALEGSYQYSSSHLYSVEGLISENVYGDKSRFRLNNVHDYMGELNEPGMYYYHLWICKGLYMVHITSGGKNEQAGEYVKKIGEKILEKFE